MFRMNSKKRVLGGIAVLALALTACGSSDEDQSAEPADQDAVAAALEEGGEITVWTWEPTIDGVVEAFEEEYPEVSVNLVNAGQTTEEYSAIQNAISAGSGIPDVAQIEYQSLPQFTQTESLVDLSKFGAGELEAEYSPGPWSSVTGGGDGVFGLPMASAPMGLFYNEELFDEHGIDVPTTWDEYLEAGREFQEADSDVYITNEVGSPTLHLALIWQVGGQPYTVDGTTMSIDFEDEGTARYAGLWDTLLGEDLIAPIATFSDEWYQAVGDGTVATLPSGAWMRPNLESGVPAGEGKWRVAPMPEWDEGTPDSAEHGGAALSLIEGGESENEALAYAFVEYANLEEGVDVRADLGAFPPTVRHLDSEEFQETEIPYFGGQQANLVLSESSSNVLKGWQFLPVQAHANSIYNDFVGPAFTSGLPMQEALNDWGEATESYATQQGFTVE